jgi:hypothetical protein
VSYVIGGYHMVPASVPYLRDVVDMFIGCMACGSFLVLVKDNILTVARFLAKAAQDTEK